MAMLLFGKFLLVSFMFAVMGVPYAIYVKRDRRWNSLPVKSRDAWYE